ncbi:MAG TPA: enoyl-CoA hydratase-related protein [Anaerolineae bacterium]
MSQSTISYETILYNVGNHVAAITMNRPERRNALNETLNRELWRAFERARDDENVRTVVLAGAGKGFCAGADLSAFQQMPTPDQVYEAILEAYQPLMELITTIEKPVIAAVNGTAAGAGASLALACDLRVMAHDASLMMAFSNVGLVPDAGATWFLVRQIGYSRAYEFAIEGKKLSAEQCLEWGLTNRVVPADRLMEEAMEWAERLAQRPTLALGLTKHALNHAARSDLASAIEYEARLQKQTIPSHDHMEGVMAFLQKREPAFKGR